MRDDLVTIVFQECTNAFGIWSAGKIQVRADEVAETMERMQDNTSRYRRVQVRAP